MSGDPIIPKDFTGTVIDNGTLEIIRQLGTGGSGVVYLALDLTSPACDPLYFAVKCMLSSSPELAKQTNTRRRLRHHQEAAIHFLASAHPNVVQVDRVVEEQGHTFIVLEYCEGGDLYEMITRKNCYAGDDDLIKSVFGQILDAVEYCHSQGIYHRDIKPENILCLKDGKTVLLSDFGLSTREAFTSEYHVGSAYYMSYETLHPGEWPCPAEYEAAPSDVWALGIILTNLICGLSPWHQATHTDQTFAAFDLDSNILLRALPISTETNAILKRIFELDPRRRIGLSELRDAVMDVQNFSSTSKTHPQARAPVHVVNSDSLALSTSPARSFFSNDSGLIWDTLQSRPTFTSSTIAEENVDDDDDEFDLGCPPLSPSSVQSRRNSADSTPATPSAFTTRFHITPIIGSPRKRVPVPRISQVGSTLPDSSDFGEGSNVKSHQRRKSISRVINKMNGWLNRK